MTEYDYSEEGYNRFMETQARISRWAEKTNRTPQSDPFTPQTPALASAVAPLPMPGIVPGPKRRDSRRDRDRSALKEDVTRRDRRRRTPPPPLLIPQDPYIGGGPISTPMPGHPHQYYPSSVQPYYAQNQYYSAPPEPRRTRSSSRSLPPPSHTLARPPPPPHSRPSPVRSHSVGQPPMAATHGHPVRSNSLPYAGPPPASAPVAPSGAPLYAAPPPRHGAAYGYSPHALPMYGYGHGPGYPGPSPLNAARGPMRPQPSRQGSMLKRVFGWTHRTSPGPMRSDSY